MLREGRNHANEVRSRQLGSRYFGEDRPNRVAAGPVGFSGGVVSIGVHLAAVDDRIAAAVLFAGSYVPRSILEQARGITIPLYMLLQWDDEGNDRQMALELFDALGSREKTLNANLGGHTGVPRHAGEDANRFFVRHLLTSPNTGGTDAIRRSWLQTVTCNGYAQQAESDDRRHFSAERRSLTMKEEKIMSNIHVPEAVRRVVTGESIALVTVEGDRVASFRIPPRA